MRPTASGGSATRTRALTLSVASDPREASDTFGRPEPLDADQNDPKSSKVRCSNTVAAETSRGALPQYIWENNGTLEKAA